jgi:sec-independent protein translocase protein TatC
VSQGEDDKEQPLVDHLVELRSRLLKAVVGIAVILLALLPFANKLYTTLALPLLKSMPEGATMIATDPIAPFFTPLKFALFLAIVLGAPWIMYQIWSFVAPGLYRHEKKLAIPILVSSVLLFYAGCAFAYYLVLPVVFAFTIGIAPEGVAVMTDIAKYLDFVVVIFLAFGITFEVPVATVIIVRLGWVSVKQLKEARPYLIVAAFVIAAILTPPDVVSQLLLAIPMCILFEIGMWAAKMVEPKAAATEASP